MKAIFLKKDKKCDVFKINGDENFFIRNQGIYVISPHSIAQTIKKPIRIGFYRPSGDQVFEFKLRRKMEPQAIYFDNDSSPLPFNKILQDNKDQIKQADNPGDDKGFFKPPVDDPSYIHQENFIFKNASQQLAGLSRLEGLKQLFKSITRIVNLRNVVLFIIMSAIVYSYIQGEFLV